MFILPFIGLLSLIVCILTHYEALRMLARSAERLSAAPRPRILYVVFGAFSSHSIHVVIFALALWVSLAPLPPGAFGPGVIPDFPLCLYVSVESYASLGSAAEFPHGPLRLFAGVEALSGLVLVGWTSAFTYWCMTSFWNEH